MIQAATAFSGGVWACQKLGELSLPTFQRAVNEAETFKLRVRLHSASTPELSKPGVLTQERPRMDVVVGRSKKQTEFGDFQGGRPQAGDSSQQAPWRFNETLTFTSSFADVFGTGIQVWMQAQSDVRFGPLQVNLSRLRSVGMCSVDFQQRVLPALAARGSDGSGAGTPSGSHQWETTVLSFPLTYVGGGDSDLSLGAVVGTVDVSFGVDVDPAEFQRVVDASTKSLLHRVAGPIREWVGSADPARWAEEAGVTAGCDRIRESCRQIDVGALADAAGCDMVKERCQRSSSGALADAAGCDLVRDRCRQVQAGALADAAAAGCDVVRERCRQIDVGAPADACELGGDGRPPRRIEDGPPQRRAHPAGGVPAGPAGPGEKARPLGSASTAALARSPSGASLSSGSSGSSAAAAPVRPAAAGATRAGALAAPLVAPPVYVYSTSVGVPGSANFATGVPSRASFATGGAARLVTSSSSHPRSGCGITSAAGPSPPARSASQEATCTPESRDK